MQNNLYIKESIGLLFTKTNNSTLFKPITTNLHKQILFFLFFLFVANSTFAASNTATGFFNRKVESLIKQLEAVNIRSSFSTQAICDNLLTNGELDNGTTDWNLYVQSGNTASLSIDNSSQLSGNNAALVDISTASGTDWHIQYVQTGKSIIAGKNYNVNLQAKAVANRRVSVMLQRTGSPYTVYWRREIDLTATANTYSFNFIADSTNIDHVAFYVNLGESTENVWIDNLSFTEVSSEELKGGLISESSVNCPTNNPRLIGNISNPYVAQNPTCNVITNTGFDDGTTDWQTAIQGGNSATFSIDNTNQLSGTNAAFIDISAVSGTVWHVELEQRGKTIEAEKSYGLSFTAKATANRPLNIALQLRDAPYTIIWDEDITLTTSAETFTFNDIVSPITDDNAGIVFKMGESTENVWIDEVYFGQQDCEPITADYRWLKQEEDGAGGWTTLTLIPGATDAIYDPPIITKNTRYQRQATRTNCADWESSNLITVDICPQQFICDSKFYQTIEVDDDYWLYEILTTPNVSINPLINLNENGIIDGINSTVFNQLEGYIYTLNMTPPYRLYRIGGDLSIQYIGNVAGFADDCFINAGAIAPDGTIYYRCVRTANIYELDLENLTVSLNCDFATIPNDNNQNNIGDLAYNPIDGFYYGTRDNTDILVKMDLDNCIESEVSLSREIVAANGAFYISADGTGYGYENSSGRLTRINLSTGLVENIGQSTPTTQVDGCSCEGIKFTKTVNVDTSYTNSTITYTFTIFNNWNTALSNITFRDTLTEGLLWAAEPQNLTGGITIGTSNVMGNNEANFTLTNIPLGISSFDMQVNIPSIYNGPDPYLNQAYLETLPILLGTTKPSDYPKTPEIDDPTPVVILKMAEICDNGLDDDGDGLMDNEDPNCAIANGECIGTNQGFENDLTDWEVLATPTITTDAYNGDKAVLLDENSESIIRVFDVNADSSYLLSFYHKGSGGTWRGLNFYFLDASDNEIFARDLRLTDATDYEEAVYAFTAPSNAAKISVRFVVYDPPATLFLDDICLKEGPSNKLRPNCEENCRLKSTGEHISAQTWLGTSETWVVHDVDNDMQLCHNEDGSITIQGNITNGRSEGGTPCGTTDGWFLEITLSNKKNWATWNGNYDTYNVDNSICADNHTTFDYWDATGTLTGTGCNTGDIYPITGNQEGYQIQVGNGASRNSCDFGMAGWTILEEDGINQVFDIYFLLDEACYELPKEICDNNIDDDGDGLTDCEDPDCQVANITNLSFSNCTLVGNNYESTLSVEVVWADPPAGENIIVSANNTTQTIDILNGTTSPAIVQFTITADNSQNNPITIDYSGSSGCTLNSTYNAPAPCPVPTNRNALCDNSSGHVGGIVFEDLSSDGVQDSGEPGLAGILVTATDSTGTTIGQTTTNNLGVFQFETLTDNIKIRLEFTAIPSGMYPTNATTFKGTTVQFEQVPSCDARLGLIDPTENDCATPNNAILENGYSLVSTLPGVDNITLVAKNITQLGTLWQTAGNRNINQAANVATAQTWTTTDFEGAAIFSTAIDPKNGTIYAIASPLHASAENTESVLFETAIVPKVFKIDAVTGVVTRIAELPGTIGLGYIDFDAVHEQLFLTNMDDGKIYRLNTDGAILSSFNPLAADDGIIGQLPALGDRVMGVAFNAINKRVYYSVWSNHYDRTNVSSNVNATFNTIRSVALDANGAFIPSSDQLEITMPYGASGFNLTTPVGDIAFNRSGDKVLLAEIPLAENTSTNQIITSSYIGVLREYQLAAGSWNLEPILAGNDEGKYDIGNQTFYKGRNSRGGVDWGYESVTSTTITGDDSYILATGDALHITAIEGDNIFGLQFMPSTGGNIANSILVDLDNNLANENLYAYGDIDIYKNYCANLSLEIGNYIWLDEDEDGIQDPNEFGMEGINVSLYNTLGDSLTSVVTNADGEYYFNDVSNGLMPNTTYYLVIGKGGQFDTSLGVLNQVNNLTTINLGTGNYADLNDSDGAIAMVGNGQPISIENYPFIEIQTGAVGQNDYSFDFGFRQICSAAFVVNDSLVLCPRSDYEGSVAVNDKNHLDKNFSVIAQPTSGTVDMNLDGTFMYTNTTSTCGNDEFRYQVCDETNVCCVSAIVYLDFNDTTRPTLANVPENDTVSCDELIPLPPQIFARDNCPRISLNVQEESTQGEDGCSLYDYTITRTWTVTDQCGNSTSAAQIVEVQDIVAPDIYRIYTMPNGKKMVAGVMELVGQNWKTINLPIDFDTKPIILHQVVTSDATIPVVAQIQNVSVSQFELKIKSEESHTAKLTRKSIAWIAIEAGAQLTDYQLDVNSLLVSETPQSVNFQNAFAAPPALFVSSQTTEEVDPFTIRQDGVNGVGATLQLQEEASNDAELTHTNERIGYLAIEKLGSLRESKGVLIGEVGTVTVNSNWATVNLNHTYSNPVIIANSLSNIDGEAATVSIRNVGLNQFEISVNEWAYLNGTHSNETISYIVIEGSIPLESPGYCDTGTDSLDISVDFKAVDNCDVSVVINYVEKDTFIGATKVITRTWAAEDECGNATTYSQEISCEGVSLQIKSILQGAMLHNDGDGLMRDDLRRKNLLPMEEPYAAINRFKHVGSGGGEVINDAALLADNGANSIVDWVFVELRDANDIDNVVATKSALIQRDGDIVTVQGDSILHFTNTRVGNYYVAVRHRNHLGIISLNTFTFSPSEVPMVDFTFNFTPVIGSHSSIEIDNLESLWSGDLNSDGKVIYQGPNNDIFFMFLHVLRDVKNEDSLPNFISRTYTNDDFNLDGSVIYQGPNNDRSTLLFNTILKHPDNPNKFSNFIIYSGGN